MHVKFPPLITPERLKADPVEALGDRPKWAALAEVIAPDPLTPTELSCTLVLFDSEDSLHRHVYLDTFAVAILFEGSRFAHSVGFNSNKGPHAAGGKDYPKWRSARDHRFNTTLGRIFHDAGPGEQVQPSKEHPRDLRTGESRIIGGRTDLRQSREEFMEDVIWALEKFAPEGFLAEEYLQNIERLFELHDKYNLQHQGGEV